MEGGKYGTNGLERTTSGNTYIPNKNPKNVTQIYAQMATHRETNEATTQYR